MRVHLTPLLIALVSFLLVSTSASAQPSNDESVCNGLSGASWGLCNAYCEVLDCESENPNASSTACLKILSEYETHTDQVIPCARVECRCWTPEDVDTLLSECEYDAFSVTCSDLLFQGQGSLLITEMECSGESGLEEMTHYLSARIDMRVGVFASCSRANVPPLPNQVTRTTTDQASACAHILRDRFQDCDTVRRSR